MIRFKYDKAKMDKLRRAGKELPRMAVAVSKSTAKKTAEDMKLVMRRGLFTLGWLSPALSVATKKAKKRAKFEFVDDPLLATGTGAGTMIGSLEVLEVPSGYRMAPYGMHRRSKMPARELWAIHENGAVINRNGHIIRIPARHAFKNAKRDFISLRIAQTNGASAQKQIKSRFSGVAR